MLHHFQVIADYRSNIRCRYGVILFLFSYFVWGDRNLQQWNLAPENRKPHSSVRCEKYLNKLNRLGVSHQSDGLKRINSAVYTSKS